MIIKLEPADVRPIYVQIMDEVRRSLVVGGIAPNDPLPSVRQLAVSSESIPTRSVRRTASSSDRELSTRQARAGDLVSEVSVNGSQRRPSPVNRGSRDARRI